MNGIQLHTPRMPFVQPASLPVEDTNPNSSTPRESPLFPPLYLHQVPTTTINTPNDTTTTPTPNPSLPLPAAFTVP